MKPLYIFDLDGTLSLADHRRSILDNHHNPNRWQDFYKASVNDQPNWPVINLMRTLSEGADIKIWSGRSEEVRESTIQWITNHVRMHFQPIEDILKMRLIGDYTPDDEMKFKWYCELDVQDRARLAGVFDDRKKVVDMWRYRACVPCFQVAPGDF